MNDSGLRSRANAIDRPTDHQLHHARAVLNPLTDVQRRAVIAVIRYETAQELLSEESDG